MRWYAKAWIAVLKSVPICTYTSLTCVSDTRPTDHSVRIFWSSFVDKSRLRTAVETSPGLDWLTGESDMMVWGRRDYGNIAALTTVARVGARCRAPVGGLLVGSVHEGVVNE